MIPSQIHDWLPQYADGELTAEQRGEVERHLADSPELRADLERWRALRRCAARVLAEEPLPAGMRERVCACLGPAGAAGRGRTYRLFGTLTAAAAVVLLSVIIWQSARSGPPGSPVSPGGIVQAGPLDVTASQFAMIYRHCAVQKHDDKLNKHGDDPNAVRIELARSQGFRVLLPDLSGDGYALDGVCPCFPQKGVRAIHAFYRKEGAQPRVVSFFSLDRPVKLRQCRAGQCCQKAPAKRTYDLAIDNEVTLVKWDEGGRSYAVAGQMGGDDLMALASAVDVALLDALQPGALESWLLTAPIYAARLP